MTLPLAVLPWWYSQYFDSEGVPLSNGSLEFYIGGTSTPLAVYSQADGAVSLGTTVDLDASGFPITGGDAPTTIWIANAPTYKVILKDENGTTVRTADGITDPGTQFAATLGTILATGSQVSTGYTVTNADWFLRLSEASGAGVLNLQPVAERTIPLLLMNVGLNDFAITPNGAETINQIAAAVTLTQAAVPPANPAMLLLPNSPSGWWMFPFSLPSW